MAHLQFVMFFAATLLITAAVFAMWPVDSRVLTGLTKAEFNAISDPMTAPPSNATAWENLVYYTPGSGVAMWTNKMFILTKVSSSHQIIALFLGVWVVGIIFVIIAMIRSGG